MHIAYRMHKVERRMVKTNALNTQGDKIKAILLKSLHFYYVKNNSNSNDLVCDRMK